MDKQRSVRWDVAAVVMFAVAALVWLSLLTHDPADNLGQMPPGIASIYQPLHSAFPLNSKIQNGAGYVGALVSDVLLQATGIGAYLIAGLMVLSGVVMIRQLPWASSWGRSIGWSLILLAVCCFPSRFGLNPRIPVPIDGGGYLGALCKVWMDNHLAHAGAVILVLSMLIGGLLLSTEYALLRYFGYAATGSMLAINYFRVPSWSLRRHREILSGTFSPKRADLPNSLTMRQDPTSISTTVEPFANPQQNQGMAFPSIRSAVQSVTRAISQTTPSETSESEVSHTSAETVATEGGPAIRIGRRATASISAADLATEPRNSVRTDLSFPKAKDPPLASVASSLLGAGKPTTPPIEDELLEGGSDEDDYEYEEQGDEEYNVDQEEAYEDEVKRKAKVLEETFKNFGFNVRVVEIETGPVIAQYEIELEAGLRLSKITGLADDLAIALRVPSVRIVAPIPGKNSVGIEVPNEQRQIVRMREVIEESGPQIKKQKIPLFLGKDVSGKSLTVDLASLPHLLIAGRTGTGKSVCLNSIISSILMTRRPDEVRMLMIDPKMVELSCYGRLPHLMHPVVIDMRKAEAILAWAVDKMEERYALLARAGVRHLTNYNQLGREELLDRLKPENEDEAELIPDHLPFIVIVVDEMADLMMTSGKEVEAHIIRLAQKSRAVGIHLILATQKPTVDVITGLIKSNLPARISFQVASRTDSRVVLDEMGADKLLGNGDMLFLWPGTSQLLRGQGTYLSDDEINAVVDHCSMGGVQNFVQELVQLKVNKDDDEGGSKPGSFKRRDDLYEAAVDIVVREGRGSCSLLQRALGIGYGRAARLIDFMAEDGIVGEYNGSQAREVSITIEQWEVMRADADAEPASKGRGKKIRRDEGWSEAPKPKASKKKKAAPREEVAVGDFEEEEPVWEDDE